MWGQITKVDPQPILDVLDAGSIPAVSTMGCDEQGNTYNINADTAAAKLAGTLNAESFVALTDINGLLLDKNDPSTLISHITVEKTKELIAQGADLRWDDPQGEMLHGRHRGRSP